MSEVESRPRGSRGRGSYRGGRGGYRGARNGTKGHIKADEQESVPTTTLEDQGEVGELKKKYGSKVPSLREVCPGWSDEDLVFALSETDGNVDLAFDRISSGTVSQWGEVKKKQPKAKDAPATTSDNAGTRGGRGRGAYEGRGRGRGTERGRSRGGRGASQANGTRTSEKPIKTGDDAGWGDSNVNATEAVGGLDPTPAIGSWDNTSAAEATTSTGDWANETSAAEPSQPVAMEELKADTVPPATKKGGWAGLFAPKPAPSKKPEPTVPVVQPEDNTLVQTTNQALPTETVQLAESQFVNESMGEPSLNQSAETPLQLTPSKDELTEENLEQIPDVSNPPVSRTAASTVASTQDPMSSAAIPIPGIRPGLSGYAASALKATAGTARSASFQRRVMEQQESVVMPLHNQTVDSAAVQFGRMGLNGDVDLDEDREDPETRMQMPDDSPAAPRASLPPSHHEIEAAAPAPPIGNETRPAPGLPPVQQQISQSSTPPAGPAYVDQYRYSQQGQKAYDPFGQQHPVQTQSQGHNQSTQEPFSNQLPSQAQNQVPSAHDYSTYYGTNVRDAYQGYYGSYGQTQETQPRSGSALGTSGPEIPSQYASSRPQNSYASAETQGSGHNTPNPALQGHQAHPSQHMPHNQSYGGYAHGYNAYGQQYPQYGNYGNHRYGPNRPQFDDVRRQDPGDYYASQYAYGQNQHYGGYSKANMYGANQQQYSYEHSASPATTGGYGQSAMSGRDNVYGRAGSAQPSDSQQTSNTNAFGGMPDPFGRSHSGFGQQHSGSEDASKYETSKASGPSPAIGQSNRPASAVNNLSSQAQQASGFPPPQSHTGQQAFGGYPQYGAHQAQSSHPQSAYAGYGSNSFTNTYGAYGSGRGWNGSYGGGH